MTASNPVASTSSSTGNRPNGSRRVVVTGIGAVTPLGLTFQSTWNNALEGRSGAAKITIFDPIDCPVTFAAEVKNFDVTAPIGPLRPNPDGPPEEIIHQASSAKDARRVGRFCHFALSAGLQAYQDSGLDCVRSKIDPDRIGINIGAGMGGLPEIEAVHDDYLAKGYRRITPFFITQSIPNMASGLLSMLLNLKGPNLCTVTACSSSSHAIGESARLIQRGDADIMIAGGAESVICRLGIGGFASMKALSTRNDAPEKASRPFDTDRDGFVMGEGSAVLVLEEYEAAKSRGARIYGELVGYGLSADAYHITSPAPGGEGGFRAMKMALTSSGLNPEQIGYVNTHGTSTPTGDIEEARAVARLFPDASKHLHLSSTKSMTGHLLGAAGALEALFSILAIREGRIPPTINLDNLDPACKELGLDFTANQTVEKQLNYALSNSFGFGGTNSTLIFGKV
ncbi:MAG: beta-ketoacyl-[acyl-carrier-protein] synthase II [Bdellovibrionales bacterium GWB1_52_6]|nr:MAG: beta-ketoacyl-[acyl-carrier-protein] synthase II [Bdellovibrionales bacterium GWB1_52_6]OFZ06041.1 MAG: beta-ketoacyl-[acyl-carrier-protein] synthase II [Bdellovibrionales bacterium GWA1_52_35]HCM39334.1 beta-ketoacyl-[acyl-carrier-protein] synthase II [Bdellovibrionales bacterium]